MNKRLVIVISLIVFFCSFPLFSYEKNENPLKIYDKAVELQENEEWYDASQYFLEVVNLNPAFSDAWFRLSECSYRLGEFDLAYQYLENAEIYEKDNNKIKNLKGMVLLALGKTDDAKSIFDEVLKKYPNDVDAHFGLAEIELYEGRISGAEEHYIEALKRQNSNRKALLSLSLLCAETGRYSQADDYLRQAMQYYSGEAEVHYLAAIIYMMEGNFKQAEKQVKISVEIAEDYNDGYELLATILYKQNRYSEVIDICDYLIGKDRNNGAPWYLKGIALEKLGLVSEAIDTWAVGVTVDPQDEMMRTIMELTAREYLPLDDYRRSQWADFHINSAKQYEGRFDKSGSLYEYQRGLLIDPRNETARFSYAQILESNGLYEQFLNQLKFLKNNSNKKLSSSVTDTIEAYESLLENTIAKKWNVDPFYLDKIRWNIAIFYTDDNSSLYHSDSNRLAAMAAADIFSGIAITSVKTQVNPIRGFGEAFKNARENKYDYFIIMSFSEGQEDMTLSSKMYSGRTGTELSDDKYYSTGNNRFSTILRRFRNGILEKLTVRGKIIKRNGKNVLIDLGRTENVVNDSTFNIVKKGKVKPADSEVGLYYKDNDVIGSLTVTLAGEEVSEAIITKQGFYDLINVDDEVVLISVPEPEQEPPVDNVPNATDKGEKLSNSEVKDSDGEEFVLEIKRSIEKPAILDLLRSIY